ncbi:hypothetical protein BKA63DRAFT_494615 [Paraphoma chrysanthemicola]|nr:hypothetical protein BKA63DRAFT_494615 [Paraphoma chrysanthemicola]
MPGAASQNGSLRSLRRLLGTMSLRSNLLKAALKIETLARPTAPVHHPAKPVIKEIAFHHGGYEFSRYDESPVIFSLKGSPQYGGGVRVFVPWLYVYILSGAKTHDPSDFYFSLKLGGEPLNFSSLDDILLESHYYVHFTDPDHWLKDKYRERILCRNFEFWTLPLEKDIVPCWMENDNEISDDAEPDIDDPPRKHHILVEQDKRSHASCLEVVARDGGCILSGAAADECLRNDVYPFSVRNERVFKPRSMRLDPCNGITLRKDLSVAWAYSEFVLLPKYGQ